MHSIRVSFLLPNHLVSTGRGKRDELGVAIKLIVKAITIRNTFKLVRIRNTFKLVRIRNTFKLVRH